MAEISENMKLIMAKVRKHIMTGNSANTPAFDLRRTAASQAPQEEPKVEKKGPKASSFKLPDLDARDV